MNALHGYDIEDLKPGMTASFAKTVTKDDLVTYAGVVGDYNPLHLSQEYARTTAFGGCIAHGMLSAGIISAVLGNELPGPGTIYLGQVLKFKAPVRPGDTVTATVTVREAAVEKKRVILDSVCTVAGKVVVEGESTMLCTSSADRRELVNA
jgi:3-hydroxybutyryl-CoA dehydratase